MVSCFCVRKGSWFETQLEFKKWEPLPCMEERSTSHLPVELSPHPSQDAVIPVYMPVIHNLPLCCPQLPPCWFLTSQACLEKGWEEALTVAQSVPFIPVSLFCCLMVLFLRSRREERIWPDWGLMCFWIMSFWLRSDVLLRIIHILKTTPVGSQEMALCDSGLVLCFLPANSNWCTPWWKKN